MLSIFFGQLRSRYEPAYTAAHCESAAVPLLLQPCDMQVKQSLLLLKQSGRAEQVCVFCGAGAEFLLV